MRLLLIRHGETTWNRDGRYQGHSDPPLSVHGEWQAQALAEELASVEVASIIASPLMRAQATAQVIAARLGLPVATDHRLMELAYGEWEGLQQAAVKQKWPEQLRLWKRAPDQVTFPGGESLSDMRHRVRSFLECAAGQSGTMLAVTHDGFARLAVLEARGEPLSAFREVRIENASITTYTEKNGRLVIADINSVAHLLNSASI
ncbi:histidine phosphatase family protein [Sulfuriferula sp.]|uniref:histidine phosphatase family protein n=1 Tax=Sulfuriferula sp. TaxID=2025307 RepID=UPI00272F063E|nr:histidine phosphatase family protein [Sulfuriferula sp.]MDP2026741.1 histidine phosphatase family protein [Sulfuriferula sp.]